MSKLSHEIEHLLKRTAEKIAELCEHGHHHGKPRIVRLLVVIRPAESIKKKETKMDKIELGQIPLGQRIPIDFVPDEAVDVKSDGKYASVAINSGDSTAHVGTAADGPESYDSEPKRFRVYVNGDGAVGQKSATVSADGHVGDGDVEIEQILNWEVVSPDATTFTNTVGKLEPIPVP